MAIYYSFLHLPSLMMMMMMTDEMSIQRRKNVAIFLHILFFLLFPYGSMANWQNETEMDFDESTFDSANGESGSRTKRQTAVQYPTIYYICGEFPNLVYTLTPCDRCRNGGRALYVQCTSAIQCTPYYPQGPTECIDGQCCTSNDLDINYPDIIHPPNFDPYNNGGQGGYIEEQFEGFCPQNFRSRIRCSAMGQCPPDQTCLNGVCCRRNKDDYMEACGGQMAIAQCVAGVCQDQFVCNTANFCCQCAVGRSMGRCNLGVCPPGYRCQSNGFCCASCPDNAMPFGLCTASDSANYNPQYTNGQRQMSCPIGYSCLQGDICCKSSIL